MRIAQRLVCLALMMVPLGADAPATPADLAPVLRRLIEANKLPGAAGAIVRGNSVVALGSAGVRKSGDATAFLPTDAVHLGSDTKAMTAVLIGRLIDEKKLAFDSTMAEVFPDLAPAMNPLMAKNTVRNLLTHTAGLPHDLDWRTLKAPRGTLPALRKAAVEKAFAAAPATAIGTYAYSNVGYVVLGAIVESKRGKAWEDVLQEQVFGPLHMTAGFGPPSTGGKIDQPWGHVSVAGNLMPVQIDNASVMGPAGTVHCSIGDWAKFVGESLHAAQGHPTLMSAPMYEQLLTPLPKGEYAGGWELVPRTWAGGTAMTHAGSNSTWFCTVWIAPKKDFAVMIAINAGGDKAQKAADEGAVKLLEWVGALPAK